MKRLLAALVLFVLALQPSLSAAVAFGSLGASTTTGGVTTADVAYPASISAGDLLVLCVGAKYNSVFTDPSSPWVAGTGNGNGTGSGASGADAGTMYPYMWVKEADGSETGNLTLTFTSVNVVHLKMFRYTKAGGTTWDYATASMGDGTPNTAWSLTPSSDPGVTGGDMLLSCTYSNTDLYTFATHTYTQTGITFGTITERNNIQNGTGDDISNLSVDVAVTSGTSSSAPTFGSTASGSSTNRPAGAGMIIRMREVAGGGSTTSRRNKGLLP
jgi:hypothetical protein